MFFYTFMKLFITLLVNVNKSRTSASSLSLRKRHVPIAVNYFGWCRESQMLMHSSITGVSNLLGHLTTTNLVFYVRWCSGDLSRAYKHCTEIWTPRTKIKANRQTRKRNRRIDMYIQKCPSIGRNRFHIWMRIRRYGVRSPLGPKQSEAICSVHLNRQDCSGGSEYSPLSTGSLVSV
jgi:hypothetical protein